SVDDDNPRYSSVCHGCIYMIPRPRGSPLFPYTTLFRSQALGSRSDLLQGGAAVAPGGVDVEVTPDVAGHQQLGQLTGQRLFDFAPAFPKLRRNVGQAQEPVELLLAPGVDDPAGGQLSHPVLADAVPQVVRQLPQPYVMLLGSREMVQSGGKRLRRHHP